MAADTSKKYVPKSKKPRGSPDPNCASYIGPGHLLVCQFSSNPSSIVQPTPDAAAHRATHRSSITTPSSSTAPKNAPDLTPNPRGIPPFPFMSSVSEYVSELADVEPTLRRFQEMISKYQFMEANKQKHAQSLREKIPEMKNTLETVKFLSKQKAKDEAVEMETTFPLADTLYAKAVVRPEKLDEVYLWLGANVMVAYPLAEAEEMLGGKLKTARQSLRAAEEDLEFLRVQITTLEVATARVYNWDVVEKRRLRAEGKLVDAPEEKGGEGQGGG